MVLLQVALITVLIFLAAYFLYGQFLAKVFSLDNKNTTPAVEYEDGNDFVPARPIILLGQHFSAISAAGPIVGPILAGIMFGWGPALLWIILGAIFIGGVHDFSALIASLRHKAKSIVEIVKEYLSPTAYFSFLIFIFLAIIYIVIVFTDITATTFMAKDSGGAVSTASMLYLLLGILLGIAIYKFKAPLFLATIVSMIILFAIIWFSQYIPFKMPALLGIEPIRIWDIILLIYCGLASIVPMWLLLQPRGYLGGFFLYITLLAGVLGILLGGGEVKIEYPFFKGFFGADNNSPLFPLLFITVACGACSGFHAIVSSGTTSKQLSKEKDSTLVAYGGMLLEGLVALIALSTLMILAQGDPLVSRGPNEIYAKGISRFLSYFGIEPTFAYTFALLAFATFVYDTLDVCTRLGRYVISELFNWEKTQASSIYGATIITLAIPIFYFLFAKEQAWKTIWPLFGTANQLLAALTLLAITVWLRKTAKKPLTFIITFLPMVLMFVMTIASLVRFVQSYISSIPTGGLLNFVGIGASLLLVLAIYIAAESIYSICTSRKKQI